MDKTNELLEFDSACIELMYISIPTMYRNVSHLIDTYPALRYSRMNEKLIELATAISTVTYGGFSSAIRNVASK